MFGRKIRFQIPFLKSVMIWDYPSHLIQNLKRDLNNLKAIMLIEIKDIMEDDYRNLDQSKIATSTLQHRHDFRYDANGIVIYETTARKTQR